MSMDQDTPSASTSPSMPQHAAQLAPALHAASSEDDYVFVSPARSAAPSTEHGVASTATSSPAPEADWACMCGSATASTIDEHERGDTETEFWFGFSDAESDADSDSSDATDGAVGATARVATGGADADEKGTAAAPPPGPLVRVTIVVRHCGADAASDIWLHLSHSAPAHSPPAPAAARAVACTVPCDHRSTAAATLGTLPVLPAPHGSSDSAAPGAAGVAPLVAADGTVAVWQLEGRAAHARAVSAPDDVRIPEGTVLVLGGATQSDGGLEFSAVNFAGGTIAVVGCSTTFERCAFTACTVVVAGTATAKFAGCELADMAAPAVVACGPSAAVRICGSPRGDHATFCRCARPLLLAGGASGHVRECDVSGMDIHADCFTASGSATQLLVEDCSFSAAVASGAPWRAAAAPTARTTRAARAWGVRVSDGATATLRACRSAGLSGGAVRVEGAAVASASDCSSSGSRRAGFMACAGGHLHLHGCTSTGDGHASVLATGVNTEVHGANVTVNSATVDGVVVQTGARAWLRACSVIDALDAGVQAAGPGVQVWLEGCTISASGRDGVTATDGAAVEARECCVDLAGKCGMHAAREASVNAADCTVRGNRTAGVQALEGGRIKLRKCHTELNGVALLVTGGGSLVTHACESRTEVGGWLSVSGEHSTACALDCTARRAVSSAVLVADGAAVLLLACSLVQSQCHAVTVRDPSTLLDMSHCTISESGGTGVVVARSGTAVMHETTVANSGECGVAASDLGAVGMDVCIIQVSADAALSVADCAVAVAHNTIFTNAANHGLRAERAALAVAMGCTLEDTGAAAVMLEDGAVVSALSCTASGSAVDYYVSSADRPPPGAPAYLGGEGGQGGSSSAAAGMAEMWRGPCGAGPGHDALDDLPLRTGGMSTLFTSECVRISEELYSVLAWDGQLGRRTLHFARGSVLCGNGPIEKGLRSLLRRRAQWLRVRFAKPGCWGGRFGADTAAGAAGVVRSVVGKASAALEKAAWFP